MLTTAVMMFDTKYISESLPFQLLSINILLDIPP